MQAGAQAEARIAQFETQLADTRRELAAAATTREALEARLRESAATVDQRSRDLESRIRELETEKSARAEPAPTPAVDREELTQLATSLAQTEDKLATALRSYTLLTRERDELAVRLAAAPSANPASTTGAPAAPVPVAEAPRSTVVTAAPSRPAASAAVAAPGAARVPAGVPVARRHTIVMGETLSGISLQYYGTVSRWPEILADNRDWLHDERSLIAGRVLRIP
jgi:nucleoid-associated protein YgaU